MTSLRLARTVPYRSAPFFCLDDRVPERQPPGDARPAASSSPRSHPRPAARACAWSRAWAAPTRCRQLAPRVRVGVSVYVAAPIWVGGSPHYHRYREQLRAHSSGGGIVNRRSNVARGAEEAGRCRRRGGRRAGLLTEGVRYDGWVKAPPDAACPPAGAVRRVHLHAACPRDAGRCRLGGPRFDALRRGAAAAAGSRAAQPPRASPTRSCSAPARCLS